MGRDLQIDINITNNCNFSCVHCGFDSGRRRMEDIDPIFVETVLRDFKELGGVKVDFTGGEPLMHKNLVAMIRCAHSLGLRTKIVTNGALCSKEKLLELKDAGLKGVSVSIDGANYELFNKIRPVSEEMYKKVVQAIKNSVALGLFTKINTVVFTLNIDKAESIVRQSIELGCQEIRFCFFAPFGRGALHRELEADPYEWLNVFENTISKYSDKIKIAAALPVMKIYGNENFYCPAKRPTFLQIFPNGDAYPCSVMASFSEPLVNLKYKTLKEFWKDRDNMADEYYKNFIKPLFDKQKGCLKLESKDGYRFVCPARKFFGQCERGAQ